MEQSLIIEGFGILFTPIGTFNTFL
jgi:hypothetical protein